MELPADNFSWDVRIRQEGTESASVSVRNHSFRVGPAVVFDPEASRISALEYVLGAVGADIVASFSAAARRCRLEIDQVEASVQGTLQNPLTYLGVVGEEGHPGLNRIKVRVYISSASPADAIERAWKESLTRSPLAQTFKEFMEVSYKLLL
jgi:OsmC-like protein